MNPVRSLLAVFLLLALPAWAQEVGTLTLVEGPLCLIRGTTVLHGAEGVRLHQGDILESSDAGFAQIEFTGKTIAALGPATRVLLLGHATGRDASGNAGELILLSGWLKAQSSENYRYSAPLLSALTQNSSLILHSTTESAEIYAESGSARIGEASLDGRARTPRIAKAGELYSRVAGKDVAVNSRPSPSFIDAMPPPFRDTFPSLMARFANKQVQPRRDHEVTYSEVQPWLTMGVAWRRGFVKRFEPRLKDPEFRRSLEAHLKDSPEWGPVVHPELYQSKALPARTDNPERQNSGR